MSITVSAGESKVKRLQVMRKGVVAAALAIDNKFRADLGDPVYRSEDRKMLARMKNPFHRSSPYRVALVTLTYSPNAKWDPKDISECIALYAHWFRRRKLRFHYVWTVELQGNGKPHYHVVMWFPQGVTPPFPDEAGWWKHGMSNAKFAYSPVGYVAKYVSKTENQSGHHLPKGARLWGYGGLTPAEKAGIAYATAPRWLKSLVSVDSHPKRRVVETRTHRTADGKLLAFTKRLTAWVVTAGDALGWAFFSPYMLDDIGPRGITLSHSGVIEAVCPEGDSHFLTHKG